MGHIAAGTLSHEAHAPDGGEQTVSVPGLVAAGVWALGLLVGLVALTTKHELLAGASLVLAVMSPWFGLAWVSHSQRRDAHSRRALHGRSSSYASGWPAL